MSIIKVYPEYIDRAQQLMDAKSTYDDISSGLDIININRTIPKLEANLLGSIEEAKIIHEQLSNKYYSINAFNNAVQAIEKIRNILPKVDLFSTSPTPLNEQYINALKVDSFGIVSDVLLKHQIIKDAKDIIKEVCE